MIRAWIAARQFEHAIKCLSADLPKRYWARLTLEQMRMLQYLASCGINNTERLHLKFKEGLGRLSENITRL